jgi:hypothetical protein
LKKFQPQVLCRIIPDALEVSRTINTLRSDSA